MRQRCASAMHLLLASLHPGDLSKNLEKRPHL